MGKTTIVTHGILEDHVAVAASSVKTSKWGGKHSHLVHIVNKEKYRLITTMATSIVDIQVKPAGTDPNIDGNTTWSSRMTCVTIVVSPMSLSTGLFYSFCSTNSVTILMLRSVDMLSPFFAVLLL